MRKPKRLRNLRIKEISLCEQGMNQHSHIVLHKAADPKPVTAPAPLVLTGEQRRIANEWARSVLKSQQIQKESATMNDITKDHTTLCKHYADKWDVTPEAAGIRLMNDRPDLVAKAYEAEQARYVAGIEARRKQVYGSE